MTQNGDSKKSPSHLLVPGLPPWSSGSSEQGPGLESRVLMTWLGAGSGRGENGVRVDFAGLGVLRAGRLLLGCGGTHRLDPPLSGSQALDPSDLKKSSWHKPEASGLTTSLGPRALPTLAPASVP